MVRIAEGFYTGLTPFLRPKQQSTGRYPEAVDSENIVETCPQLLSDPAFLQRDRDTDRVTQPARRS